MKLKTNRYICRWYRILFFSSLRRFW